MNVLSETNNLLLAHEFETAWLKEKSTGIILFKDEFYGDPDCGLIGEDNDWAAIGGEHLTIWSNGEVKIINRSIVKWVVAMRIKSKNIIEVLIDPWREEAAVWEVNVDTLNAVKVRDFTSYIEKEYTEEIEW